MLVVARYYFPFQEEKFPKVLTLMGIMEGMKIYSSIYPFYFLDVLLFLECPFKIVNPKFWKLEWSTYEIIIILRRKTI